MYQPLDGSFYKATKIRAGMKIKDNGKETFNISLVLFIRNKFQNQFRYQLPAYKASQLKCNLDSQIQKQPPEIFYKKGALKNFTKFTGKHLCQSLFFNKIAGLRRATLLNTILWHRYFPVNFAKLLRTSFLQSTFGRLLLYPYL